MSATIAQLQLSFSEIQNQKFPLPKNYRSTFRNPKSKIYFSKILFEKLSLNFQRSTFRKNLKFTFQKYFSKNYCSTFPKNLRKIIAQLFETLSSKNVSAGGAKLFLPKVFWLNWRKDVLPSLKRPFGSTGRTIDGWVVVEIFEKPAKLLSKDSAQVFLKSSCQK